MRSRSFVKPGRDIVVIAHNIRSIQNVGAILRTAECLGVRQVYATGWTPNLERSSDGSYLPLLPHIKAKLAGQLHHTALGAEQYVRLTARPDILDLVKSLRKSGYYIVGLEQSPASVPLDQFRPLDKLALLLGEEVRGLDATLQNTCDQLIELAMFGRKESYNVSVATGIALYYLSLAGS